MIVILAVVCMSIRNHFQKLDWSDNLSVAVTMPGKDEVSLDIHGV